MVPCEKMKCSNNVRVFGSLIARHINYMYVIWYFLWFRSNLASVYPATYYLYLQFRNPLQTWDTSLASVPSMCPHCRMRIVFLSDSSDEEMQSSLQEIGEGEDEEISCLYSNCWAVIGSRSVLIYRRFIEDHYYHTYSVHVPWLVGCNSEWVSRQFKRVKSLHFSLD